jgi:pantoate--beta-alanine ligase
MQVIRTRESLQRLSDQCRAQGKLIALVPTMGALHAGHLSLVAEGHQRADEVWVSLFLNPTQFSDAKDLDAYPSTEEQDLELCRRAGAHVVWMPTREEVYPPGAQTWVEVRELSKPLCGSSRAGHFLGVSTVVSKLFLAAKPHYAIFGEKDFQQLAIIKRMVQDMGFDLEVIGAPTIREPDGLALSSRNVNLGPIARREALCIARALDRANDMASTGSASYDAVLDTVRAELNTTTLGQIDYVELCDPVTLESVSGDLSGPTLLAIAMYFQSENTDVAAPQVRLIDNRVLLR